MFGLFYPVILLANLAMIFFWIFVEFKYLFLSLIVIFAGWFHLQGFINFSGKSADTSDLKILTYNMGFSYPLRSGSQESREKNKERLKNFFLSQSDIDVFCLQESSSFSRKILKKNFADYDIHEIDKRGTFMCSRYPILHSGEISFGTSTNSCLWADIKMKEDTIRIYNMHLQSNRVSNDAVLVIDNVNLQEKKTWDGIRGILRKYSSASRIRARQSMKVAEHAASSRYPTIICGDGNDPPTSYTYSRFSENYQDSFIKAGSGVGTTYAGKIPMLRIDYIFVDDQFQVNSFDILKENFSDHYAVKGGYIIK
jgi:endonuclease/exonuclease/phosphatase family metal-dependent hydrolase